MTQPELGQRRNEFADLDIDQLAELYVAIRTSIETAKDQMAALNYEFHIRMMEDGNAKALPSGKYEIRLARRSAKYDAEKLIAEIEGEIDPMELALLIRPERTETKIVPAGINGNKARSLMGKYKGRVARIIEDARIDAQVLTVTKKKEVEKRKFF
jgi:hypothetical protein|tara:strand:+ start:464 stop:931 length:468 start_codon:yes stop_codon:yes gene_type:complete